MVKYKEQVLFAGAHAAISYSGNWCNSMCEYYPTVVVYYYEAGELKTSSHSVNCDSGHQPSELVSTTDPEQAQMWAAEVKRREEARRAEAAAKEAATVRRGKKVEVVSGRKIKIGTVGECFWCGETKFGWSCGMILADGSKVFTALRNVKVYQNPQLTLGAA